MAYANVLQEHSTKPSDPADLAVLQEEVKIAERREVKLSVRADQHRSVCRSSEYKNEMMLRPPF